jgi:hypothetical protein
MTLISKVYLKLTLLGEFWLSKTFHFQVASLAAFFLIKNGFNAEVGNIQDAYLPASQALPKPTGYFSASLGNLILAKIFKINSVESWIILHLIILIITFAIILWIVYRSTQTDQSILILMIFSLTSFSTLPGSIGKYDVITFFGGVLLVLSTKTSTSVLAISIMALGNPEQAILASVCLFVLSLNKVFDFCKSKAKLSMSVSILIYLVIQGWMLSNSMVSNRITLIPYYLNLSISNFVNSPLNTLWFWMGIGWITILTVIFYFDGKERMKILGSLILIPATATILTVDGARVYGLIILPSFMVVSIWAANKVIKEAGNINFIIGSYFLLWIILPTSNNSGYLGRELSKIMDSFLIPFSNLTVEIGRRLVS